MIDFINNKGVHGATMETKTPEMSSSQPSTAIATFRLACAKFPVWKIWDKQWIKYFSSFYLGLMQYGALAVWMSSGLGKLKVVIKEEEWHPNSFIQLPVQVGFLTT